MVVDDKAVRLIALGKTRVDAFERELRTWTFVLFVFSRLSVSPTQCLLNIAQVEANQSVSQQNGRDSARASEPVHSSFAYLQDLGELLSSQILDLLLQWVVSIALARFRARVPTARLVVIC